MTNAIKEDILKVLKLKEPKIITVLPDRPDIYLGVIRPQNNEKSEQLKWIAERVKLKQSLCEKILVFFPNIREVSQFYGWLEDELEEKMYKDGSFNTQDRLVDMFHAGMDKSVQERVMAGFMDRQLRVVCATVAFGIGVSISDIDIVVLWGVPKTCLGLWQEIGRAARGQSRGMAIIYRTGYTLGRCDKAVNEALAAACIRRGILSNFTLCGEDLPTQVPCHMKCLKAPCTCAFCMCCSACQELCNCQYSQDPLAEVLYGDSQNL